MNPNTNHSFNSFLVTINFTKSIHSKLNFITGKSNIIWWFVPWAPKKQLRTLPWPCEFILSLWQNCLKFVNYWFMQCITIRFRMNFFTT